MVNLRGVIVPIIDLRLKLGLPEPRYDSVTVTIVLNIGDQVVGVVVDSVSDVLALTSEGIKPAPGFNGSVKTAYIIGIGTLQDGERQRMLIMMDIEKLISGAEMGILAQAVQ